VTDDLPVRPVPPGQPEIRISDTDRNRAIEFLRYHCTDGRLTLDEFSDRITLVYEAKTGGDLDKITSDLPARPLSSTPVMGQARPQSGMQSAGALSPGGSTVLAPRKSRAVKWTVSVFSGNHQRGRWRIEGETNALAVMGDSRLDLREAEVVGPEAVINAFAVMGGVDVIVPEGIAVELTGFAFMGGKHAKIRDVPVIPGSPIIRVRAFAFMGGVTVRSKGPSVPRLPRGRDRVRARERDRANRHAHHDPHAATAAWPASPALPTPPAPPAPPKLRGIEAVAKDARDEWQAVRQRVAPEGTVTIMFSDIEGFTPMTERLGDYKANALLQEHYRLFRDELGTHGGFEVKVHGDGFMVAFSSASRAVRCARTIQQAQARWNNDHPDVAMHVRMGLHTGEAIRDADDFLGTTVNLASRIASSASGNEIVVSALLRELCVSTGEFEFNEGCDVELKGLSQLQRVYTVAW
jgi:class 3 adenylate cyclase